MNNTAGWHAPTRRTASDYAPRLRLIPSQIALMVPHGKDMRSDLLHQTSQLGEFRSDPNRCIRQKRDRRLCMLIGCDICGFGCLPFR